MIASQPYPDGYYLMLGLFALALVAMFVSIMAVLRKWKTEEVMEERDQAVALLEEVVELTPCHLIAGVCFAHHGGSIFTGCSNAKIVSFLGLQLPAPVEPKTPASFTKEKNEDG